MLNKFGQYYKRKVIKHALRLAVYKRDNFTCQYCGLCMNVENLQIDHVIPVSRGGTNHISNLITSCATCNKEKGARLSYLKLGEKIKALRKGRFVQEQLAEKVGVHINTIVPDANSLAKIVEVLETTPSKLLDKDKNSFAPLKENVNVQEVKHERHDPPAEKHLTLDEKIGKLSHTFNDGEKLELPDTEKGYALFDEKILMQKIGLN